MRILYFDCFAGISGDMTLGAFLDLGVSEEKLVSELSKLNIDGYKINVSKKAKNGIVGTNVDVVLNSEDTNEEHTHSHKHVQEKDHNHKHTHNHKYAHNHDHNHFNVQGEHNHEDLAHVHSHEEKYTEHHHRSFKDIQQLIENSQLEQRVKDLSIKVFYNVAKAEGKIHGKPIDEVHFHEVGAIDSIVDIVGTAICLNELDVEKVISSPLHIGMGTVKCQHGVIPVPAPATLEILKGGKVPIYTTAVKKETVTPTGAAIVATLAQEYSDMPEGIVTDIGYGAGKRDTEIANMLRLVIVEGEKKLLNDGIVIEANIDDMTGEYAGYAMEKLIEGGALDVFYTPIYMKKNRPAFKLSVLCSEENLDKLKIIILKETSTIGIRTYKTERTVMDRQIETVNTLYGEARVKVSSYDDVVKVAPEYEDCKTLAMENGVSLERIYREVKQEYYNRF